MSNVMDAMAPVVRDRRTPSINLPIGSGPSPLFSPPLSNQGVYLFGERLSLVPSGEQRVTVVVVTIPEPYAPIEDAPVFRLSNRRVASMRHERRGRLQPLPLPPDD